MHWALECTAVPSSGEVEWLATGRELCRRAGQHALAWVVNSVRGGVAFTGTSVHPVSCTRAVVYEDLALSVLWQCQIGSNT